MSDKKPADDPSAGKKDEKLIEKEKKHKRFVEELRRSAEKLGYLHTFIKTRYGAASGNSRLESDRNCARIRSWVIK